jgi:hypothetical protein
MDLTKEKIMHLHPDLINELISKKRLSKQLAVNLIDQHGPALSDGSVTDKPITIALIAPPSNSVAELTTAGSIAGERPASFGFNKPTWTCSTCSCSYTNA